MVGIATAFVLVRTGISYSIKVPNSRVRARIISDLCVYLALITLIAMAVIYRYIIPDMYEVDRVAAEEEPLSAHFVPDADFYLRCQYALIVLFWTSVWAVKFSILTFYKSLFQNLHTRILKWSWWAVMIITGLFYLGCWATQIISCWPIWTYFHIGKCRYDRDKDYTNFTAGLCNTPRDTRISNDSLFVTVVLDTVSDCIGKFAYSKLALLSSHVQ